MRAENLQPTKICAPIENVHGVSFYDLLDSAIYGHYIQLEGQPAQGTFGGVTSWSGPQDCAIRFRATCGQIDVFAITSVHSTFRTAIDRVPQNTGSLFFQSDSGGVHAWTPFASGLDTGAEHEYILMFGSSAGTSFYCNKVRVFGGSGINTTALASRPLILGIGDSVMTGADIPNFLTATDFGGAR